MSLAKTLKVPVMSSSLATSTIKTRKRLIAITDVKMVKHLSITDYYIT
jgi:hypothetical protein